MGFVAEAALIALREGLEAFLIVGILLGFVTKLGRLDARKWVWMGLAAGVAGSILLGFLVQVFLLDVFENRGGGEWFELVAALVAVGVLTYMVFWMWKHTRTLMVELRERVGAALEQNMLWVVAALVFFSVLREGLEVVLFYAALAQRNAPVDLAWSGLLGAVVSVGIVAAILRSTIHLNLQKFFGVTGILLVFVAAGLLVHCVHAATDVGLIRHGAALWDTSAFISDDGAAGRILHALFGYTAAPTLLQALLYFGYLFGVGFPYLSSLGAFRSQGTKRIRKGSVVAAALIVWLATVATVWGAATATPADHDAHFLSDHDAHKGPSHAELFANATSIVKNHTGKIGILIRDHGEPIHYNASTYESLKEFIRGIWSYTGLPPEVLTVDQGSYFVDSKHPFDDQPHVDRALVDPWLKPYAQAAVPVTDPLGTGHLSGHYYFMGGPGPGAGEGDVFEIFGLAAYRDWIKMNDHSPRYEQGLDSWHYLATHLKKHYGDKVVVAFAHGHDPKVDPNETLHAAAHNLVANGVTVVLDAYQSSVFSDAMNSCMMRPHAHHALEHAGFKGRIVTVGMAGTQAFWGEATARYATQLVSELPNATKISIHLSQHGAKPGGKNPCDPNGGPDQYEANLRVQYEVAREAVEKALKARGNVTVRHVYGQGADKADDGVLSPMEALAQDKKDGVEHAIVIPYEFWGDALDNLVYLRESLGFKPSNAPYYDENFETRLSYQGIRVRVASAFFETALKSDAELVRIAEALESLKEVAR